MSIIRDGIQSADLDVPVASPTLNLDFANSQELDPRITFTRGSVGTFVNKNGLIETAPANVPRFDYDPISGECRGLLIEESGANLCTYSNNFTGADWSKVAGNYPDPVITSNATTSPDGTNNASLFEAPLVKYYYWRNNAVPETTSVKTFSIFCKAAKTGLATFRCFSGTAPFNAIAAFNLYNGTVTTSGPMTAYAIPYPNGWYRCIMTRTDANLKQPYNFEITGYASFYIYGAQVEEGTFPTSYIPTTTATVTRSADNASMTGTNFSSWYNQTEGTFFLDASSSGIYNNHIIGQGTGGIYVAGNFVEWWSGSKLLGPTTNSVSWTLGAKTSASYNSNGRSLCLSGGPILSNFTTLPTQTSINLGSRRSISGSYLSGCLSRLTYYPKALSPAQLQYLTQ